MQRYRERKGENQGSYPSCASPPGARSSSSGPVRSQDVAAQCRSQGLGRPFTAFPSHYLWAGGTQTAHWNASTTGSALTCYDMATSLHCVILLDISVFQQLPAVECSWNTEESVIKQFSRNAEDAHSWKKGTDKPACILKLFIESPSSKWLKIQV